MIGYKVEPTWITLGILADITDQAMRQIEYMHFDR